MIEYFVESDFLKVKKQRKLVLMTFFIVLGVYLFLSVGMFLWYRALPYNSSRIALVKAIHYSLTAIMVIFGMLFLGIKYKRVNRFYKKCNHLLTAQKDTSTGNFLEYDESLQNKEGVDYKALIFIEWNKYKNDFFERKVLVFYEREFPEIPENANVRYTTQGNVLFSYEILDDTVNEETENNDKENNK